MTIYEAQLSWFFKWFNKIENSYNKQAAEMEGGKKNLKIGKFLSHHSKSLNMLT